MTLADLISEFETLYELGSSAMGGFEQPEIIRLLEVEQYKLINHKFGGNNVYGSKYPETNKRIDDLDRLIVQKINVASSSARANYRTVLIPSDLLHLVEVMIIASPDIVGGGDLVANVQSAVQIKLSDNARFIKNSRNNAPYIKQPVYSFTGVNDSGDRIIRVYGSTDAINNYVDQSETSFKVDIMYIKKPANLISLSGSLNTTLVDFNDDVYHELVRATVDTAISIVSPQKVEVNQLQYKKSE